MRYYIRACIINCIKRKKCRGHTIRLKALSISIKLSISTSRRLAGHREATLRLIPVFLIMSEMFSLRLMKRKYAATLKADSVLTLRVDAVKHVKATVFSV